jgi:hypothetical protein
MRAAAGELDMRLDVVAYRADADLDGRAARSLALKVGILDALDAVRA